MTTEPTSTGYHAIEQVNGKTVIGLGETREEAMVNCYFLVERNRQQRALGAGR